MSLNYQNDVGKYLEQTSLIGKGITNGSSIDLEEVWDWKGKTLS